ncbi:hypothetical protein D3C73_1097120 [compost metagenome]
MLALDLAVIPVLPAIFRLLNAIALRHLQGVLESFLQIRSKHLRHVPANQRRRRPATGEHHALGVEHKDITVLVDKFTLSTERRQRLVAILVVVGQGFFQQGNGRLAVVLFRPGGLRLAQAQQKHAAQQGKPMQKPHCASLVPDGVSRA